MTVERLVTLLIICTPLTIILLGLVLAGATGDLPRLLHTFHRTARTTPQPAPAAATTGRHRLTPSPRPRPRPHPRPATC